MNAPDNIYIHDAEMNDPIDDPWLEARPHRSNDGQARYIRHDIHAAVVAENEELRKQIKIVQNAARNLEISGREIAKHDLARAEKLFSESKPEVIDSEREANSLLTEENLRLEQENEQLRARLNAAMEWQPIAEAKLEPKTCLIIWQVDECAWFEAFYDGRNFVKETMWAEPDQVSHVMLIKPQSALGE